jgi:O-antigen/teichoic acid export membrane protein
MMLPQSAAAGPLIGDLPHWERRDHKTIVYGGGLLLLASAFGNGLNYIFGIFLARSLGSDDFGLYALTLTMFNILTLVAVFGVDVGAVKFVSQHLGERQLCKAKAILIAAASLVFGSGLITALGLAVLAPGLALTVYGNPDITISFRLFALAIPFATVTIVLISALQAFQTVRYTVLIKYLWEPAAKFVLAALAIFAGFQLLGVISAIVLTLGISAALVIRATHRVLSNSEEVLDVWNLREVRALLVYCLPLAVANLFGIVAPRSDILMLGYWTNASDAGVYLAAFQTAAVMALVLSAFDASLAPIISRAWSMQDQTRMGESYRVVSRLSLTVSLPIFCSLVLFPDEILSLFGPGFVQGSTALILLACGQIFNNAMGSANTVLLMSGQSRIVMTNTIVMGVVLVALTASLIPYWGINGAAIGASATFIMTNIIRNLQVWRLYRVQPCSWDLAKPIAAAASTGICIVMLRSSVSLPSPVSMVLMGLLYVTVLWLLGVHQQDRIMLGSMCSRWKSFYERN